MELISYQQKIKHLYWRAGCGPSFDAYSSNESISIHIDRIFNASKNFTPILLTDIQGEVDEPTSQDKMADKQKRGIKRREDRVKLGYTTVEKLSTGDSFLREKMAFFWSNHFACQTNFMQVGLDYINTIREHALGSFSDLLKATCKSAAIITFLNSKKNIKKSPNENFARELMELFTLGRGNYTETDVREASRAFTGWSFDKSLKFFVNNSNHDADAKTILGKTGNLTGDDVLDIILQKKQCARFVTTKVYRYFVNDLPDNERIEKLADLFFNSGYDIEKLMRAIFSSDWFYEKENVGVKIKSPVDLLAGMMKIFQVQIHDDSRFLAYMRMTGQVIFQPPNVAGWPIGRGWIDNSSLMVRLNLPYWIFEKRHPVIQPEESYDAQDVMMGAQNDSKLQSLITYNFDGIKKYFSKTDINQLAPDMMGFLLLSQPTVTNTKVLANADPNKNQVKEVALHILSMPEYQLC